MLKRLTLFLLFLHSTCATLYKNLEIVSNDFIVFEGIFGAFNNEIELKRSVSSVEDVIVKLYDGNLRKSTPSVNFKMKKRTTEIDSNIKDKLESWFPSSKVRPIQRSSFFQSEEGDAFFLSKNNSFFAFAAIINDEVIVLDSNARNSNQREYKCHLGVPDVRERNLQSEQVWEDCYEGQHTPQKLAIGITFTDRMIQKFASQDEAEYHILLMMNGANLVYKSQLNIELVLADIAKTKRHEEITDCRKIKSSLYNFNNLSKASKQALWVYIDDCIEEFDEGEAIVAGIAFLGTMCAKESNVAAMYFIGEQSWLIFAHEIGHIFGARHSFENGVGTTGGIMDYGDGTINGRYQFNDLRKREVCTNIERKIQRNECREHGLYLCQDSDPTFVYPSQDSDEMMSCAELTDFCDYGNGFISQICPVTCSSCHKIQTDLPRFDFTLYPSKTPTNSPTHYPTSSPTGYPTIYLTEFPTIAPTSKSSSAAESLFSAFPTTTPTNYPTSYPTLNPTKYPSVSPTVFPTLFPTSNEITDDRKSASEDGKT